MFYLTFLMNTCGWGYLKVKKTGIIMLGYSRIGSVQFSNL